MKHELRLLIHSSLCWCVCDPQGRRGDLLVSLCYNPTANTITVNIIKARNLKAMDIGGTSGTPPCLFIEPLLSLTQLTSLKHQSHYFPSFVGCHAAPFFMFGHLLTRPCSGRWLPSWVAG